MTEAAHNAFKGRNNLLTKLYKAQRMAEQANNLVKAKSSIIANIREHQLESIEDTFPENPTEDEIIDAVRDFAMLMVKRSSHVRGAHFRMPGFTIATGKTKPPVPSEYYESMVTVNPLESGIPWISSS